MKEAIKAVARRLVVMQFRWGFGALAFVVLGGLCAWISETLLAWMLLPIIIVSIAAGLWWSSWFDEHFQA